MRILVTGGAGFIGSHLCEALVQQGNQVTVLDDLSTGRFENIEHIPGLTSVIDSTLNKEIVRDLVREADVVYHLAATVGVQLVVEQPSQRGRGMGGGVESHVVDRTTSSELEVKDRSD